MKQLTESIPYKNIINRPARSIALMILAALMTGSVFCGTVIVQSLNRGLTSLRGRMGADIMVVPFEATTKSDVDLENMILFGNMGYFYMDASLADKIAACEGIGQISNQYFLSTVSSGCCSVPVQIIGFDPETDFTITPWIRNSGGGTLAEGEIVVGHRLNAFVGDVLTFYGEDVKVAAKLDETGTGLDTAVYANGATVRNLIRASVSLNLNTQKVKDPGKVISCVLINVADGYPVEDVLNDINIHVRGVKAFRTAGMLEGISASLRGISRIALLLAVLVWAFCLIVLAIAFTMSVKERKKEFAVLRVLGASAKRVAALVTTESLLITFSGAVTGVVTGCVVLIPFAGVIEDALALPFLLPGIPVIAAFALLSVLTGVFCGVMASAHAAAGVSRTDASLALREV